MLRWGDVAGCTTKPSVKSASDVIMSQTTATTARPRRLAFIAAGRDHTVTSASLPTTWRRHHIITTTTLSQRRTWPHHTGHWSMVDEHRTLATHRQTGTAGAMVLLRTRSAWRHGYSCTQPRCWRLLPSFSRYAMTTLSHDVVAFLSICAWGCVWTTFQPVVFTARCTLVQSAVLRSHVVCPSVCL